MTNLRTYRGIEMGLTLWCRDKFVNNLVTLFTLFEICTAFVRADIFLAEYPTVWFVGACVCCTSAHA